MLSESIRRLRPNEKLNGTYWFAAYDASWAKTPGVNRLLGLDYSLRDRWRALRRYGVRLVNCDVENRRAFRKGSQNFALLKTPGSWSDELRDAGWRQIAQTLCRGGLLVTTEEIPDAVKDSFAKIEDPLDGFNGLEFVHLTQGYTFTGYYPSKFDFYERN